MSEGIRNMELLIFIKIVILFLNNILVKANV